MVVSKLISTEEAISKAYLLAGVDNIKEVAEILRQAIIKAFKDTKDIEYPPNAEDLEVKSGVIPEILESFLCMLTTGKPEPTSDRAERLIFSIRQDLCRAVFNGELKLPKHILLCMALRHLYRSKKLITILNRLGHCENNSFAIDVENAIEAALDESNSAVPSGIISGPENAVTYTAWDNHNKNLTGIHGPSCINATAGMICQETVNLTDPPPKPQLPKFKRKGIPVKRRIDEPLAAGSILY